MITTTHLIILADRASAHLLLVRDGKIIKKMDVEKDDVPQKVKHGENAWDAQDKIFRHIEDHVKRHLEKVAHVAGEFVKNEKINGVLIGGHKTLFAKIEKELKYPLSKKVLGSFVTELKAEQGEIVKRINNFLDKLENEKVQKKLEKALS